MRPLARLASALAPALLLVACAAPSTPVSPVASPSATGLPGLVLRDLDVEPIERPTAGIAIAFDAVAGAELVATLPAELDFASQALVCVYLGERPTSGWRLDLDSASLVDGELRILARENQPRGDGGEPQLTYPADCALVNRKAIPTGELIVRADDTISDEFIVSGSVVVPPPSNAP